MLTCPACAQKTLREMSTAELLTLAPWISQPLSIYWYFVDSVSVGRTLLDKKPDAVFLLCSACYFVDVITRPELNALRGIRRIARRELAKMYHVPGSIEDKNALAARYYEGLPERWRRLCPAFWWKNTETKKALEKLGLRQEGQS